MTDAGDIGADDDLGGVSIDGYVRQDYGALDPEAMRGLRMLPLLGKHRGIFDEQDAIFTYARAANGQVLTVTVTDKNGDDVMTLSASFEVDAESGAITIESLGDKTTQEDIEKFLIQQIPHRRNIDRYHGAVDEERKSVAKLILAILGDAEENNVEGVKSYVEANLPSADVEPKSPNFKTIDPDDAEQTIDLLKQGREDGARHVFSALNRMFKDNQATPEKVRRALNNMIKGVRGL